jgi:hypothetical protein
MARMRQSPFRGLFVVALVLLLTAPALAAAPRIVRYPGGPARIVIPVRASLLVRLDGKRTWSDLVVRGPAVAIHRVHYETDPGYLEWRVTGARVGKASLTTRGQRDCDGCDPDPLTVSFTVVVIRR